MLIKIAEIADILDKNGYHESANNVSYLLKEAQLFDALRTLFDPAYSGLERDSSYWKRLQRGWQRGKMDRGLGLLLAINAERTKINKKIEELAHPLLEYKEQIADFWVKIKTGADDFSSLDFKEELKKLNHAVKEMSKIINSKELRKALDMRNRLNSQQIKALEKVRGLDDENKEYLAAILRGEQPIPLRTTAPESSETSTTLRMWLKKKPLTKLPMFAHAQTPAGKHQFREFMEEYGFNPKSITDYFMENGEAQAEGFDRFGKEFGELLRRAHSIQMYDDELQRGVRKPKEKKEELPGAIPEKKMEETPTPVMVKKPDIEKTKEEITAPDLAAQEIMQRQEMQNKLDKLRQEREEQKQKDIEMVRRIQEVLKQQKAPKVSKSSQERLERSIRTLGRTQQVRKIMAASLWGESSPVYFNDPMFGMHDKDDPGPDIFEALPEGRERFHEEKHFDTEEVEYYKGRDPDYDEGFDMRRDPSLTPSDDDYEPQREEPKMALTPTEEAVELLSSVRQIDRQIKKLIDMANPDNRYSEEIRLERLEKKKHELLQQLKALRASGKINPEGW